MNSLWLDGIVLPHFPKLHADVHTDVLIIGGGLAGILCAYFLKQAGVDYTLVEAKTIGSGVTQNTSAKITSQHGLIYDNLIKSIGTQKAKKYLDANESALKKYSELCSKIECEFERKDAYVYSLHDEKKIEREVMAVQKLGLLAEYQKEIPLPFPVSGAIKFKNQAQFHPMEFISAIVNGLNIYENTIVREIKEDVVLTDYGKVYAKKIIVATHFPILNKHGSYFMKMYQHRSYVLALENAANLNGMYLEETQNGMSFRNYSNLLLIGGGDHRTGKKGGGWKELRDYAQKYYPNARAKFYWATQDCMTLDGVPYIGQYSKNTKQLYVATGFNKWGMTSSMVAAELLTDMILERKNEYEDVFSPSRSMLKPQLFINSLETLSNFITPSTKRCTHLGCVLKWNTNERTWDCPCHGSRFTEEGKVIENPANRDLS